MAIQKLTKARLAQILIMLSLLIGAFFWRTFTYEAINVVDCSGKQRCDVNIGTTKMIISKTSEGFSIETSKIDNLKVDLTQSGDFITFDNELTSIDWNNISGTRIINIKVNQKIIQVHL